MIFHCPYPYVFNIGFFLFTLIQRNALNLDDGEYGCMIAVCLVNFVVMAFLSTKDIAEKWKGAMACGFFNITLLTLAWGMQWELIKAYYAIYAFGMAAVAMVNSYYIYEFLVKRDNYLEQEGDNGQDKNLKIIIT